MLLSPMFISILLLFLWLFYQSFLFWYFFSRFLRAHRPDEFPVSKSDWPDNRAGTKRGLCSPSFACAFIYVRRHGITNATHPLFCFVGLNPPPPPFPARWFSLSETPNRYRTCHQNAAACSVYTYTLSIRRTYIIFPLLGLLAGWLGTLCIET